MTQPQQIPLSNLVVFGDSLSDIGIMNKTFLGGFAKAIGEMTTNETGRYSDGRNWTDYIYEWVGSDSLVGLDAGATKKKSTVFQSLTENSKIPNSNSVEKGPLVYYANFAKGGAVAANDKLAKGGTLSYLTAQCDQYIEQRKKLGAKFTGATLHVIWIGLNDIVTAERADTQGPEVVYDKAPMEVATLDPLWKKYPADEETPLLAEHNPAYVIGKTMQETPKGQGVIPMISEVVSLCNRIVQAFPDDSHDQHFLFISLPDPNIAPRIVEQKKKGELAIVAQFVRLTQRYNKILRSVALSGWQDTEAGVLPGNITFVPMYERLNYICGHPQEFGLRSKKQTDEISVKYGGTDTDTDEMAAARNFFTITDAAHPTEAVYKLIALKIAEDMLAKGYALGRLNATRWAHDKQYI
ncbi:SGNH/GDSL hydrolase family protein [Nocardia alni]|uniref:SGNH/GDSL hydrolase family protein n=1 Tax=Nocardia alni TaxID=2815723 RepID=UPI001C229487|nr:SGNH/GDSL hydrolase family protein [Nocardia alni]